MGILDDTPAGKLVTTVMFAFAEFERDMTVERTQEGKAIARLNPNFREGRPRKFSPIQIQHALSLLDDYSYKQVEDMTGISVPTLSRAKRQQRNELSLNHIPQSQEKLTTGPDDQLQLQLSDFPEYLP
jgi:DNA invertase Pin-like site-specific DNA recombinase